ncbi:hypothetical protein OIU77_013330 [Salix suchowensis]|uniref:Chlorophyll a-b binding protein, chloroplastic n=1 Tax=Salix suchowensis TaxID=1278906 RepID=A0ABQ8ZTI0_9ROSI|nr:hypothetical protein OIU77_013330 [Salix suchowensis]
MAALVSPCLLNGCLASPVHLTSTAQPPVTLGSTHFDWARFPENLERYKESELIHCRWAMLAVPGILVPEALGLGNWVKAQEWAATPGGQATYLGTASSMGNPPRRLGH